MTCPQCASHPDTPTAYCTACGRDLRAGLETHDPGLFYGGTREPAVGAGETTEPVPDVPGATSSGRAPGRHATSRGGGHRPTPVKEMVGSERAAWIDSVWGPARRVER